MKFYLFAKFFQEYEVGKLMEKCAELGIDGPTAMVREGYWIDPKNIAQTADFVRKATEYGLEVKYADTPYSPYDDGIERAFSVFAENGIENARLAYIEKKSVSDVRLLADKARAYAEAAAKIAEKYKIRAVIQLHGGMYPHNATSAYPIVRDLDPRYIGIKIDPGNNIQQEGYEHFPYQINLLREYIAAVGAKSGAVYRDEANKTNRTNGWKRVNVPAQDGIADYRQIYDTLRKIGFDGPSVLMPFYDENDNATLCEKLKGEIAYLKSCAGVEV